MRLRSKTCCWPLCCSSAPFPAPSHHPPLPSCLADPDIDPSWYTGRGIRPVGRFGRRRAPGEGTPAAGDGWPGGCVPRRQHPVPPSQEEPTA
uniref:Uncharacterized protein n=1 Tax=Dromaius novaehollandiae TaxID=8790 RepID=A0A8C4K6F9_DRONO